MILFLRALFLVVLASMVAVTVWASLGVPLTHIPRAVLGHPWFIATLCDAYWAFVTFYVWVAWKERSLAARILWFTSIMALGNIAMAIYLLRELFRIPASGTLETVVSVRHPGRVVLPAILTVIGGGVYLLS
jgi:hypothetical protein